MAAPKKGPAKKAAVRTPRSWPCPNCTGPLDRKPVTSGLLGVDKVPCPHCRWTVRVERKR